MVDLINRELVKKCGKAYPQGTILVLYAEPRATPEHYFQQLARDIRVPDGGPFTEIYLTCLFGESGQGSKGGYRRYPQQVCK